MLFPRRILPALEGQLASREIVVLTGMRRVGKTTALRMIFDRIESSNKTFLDLENPIEQRVFDELDYNNIWYNLRSYAISKNEKAFVFLDEIQAYPPVVKAIKYLYDHYDVKFYVTGSSSYYLKNLFSESLAGRKVIFDLYPLDFSEFLIFKVHEKEFLEAFSEKELRKNIVSYEKTKKLFDEYLEYGGFPQVVVTDDLRQKVCQLQDIIKSYFEKDVQRLADFRHMDQFRNLLLLLLQRVGAKLEPGKLASEVGVSRQTVYSYLAFLQGTYFIDLVAPFTRNRDREVSGTKKVYVCDTGFANQFAKVSAGAMLENAVFLNLRKYGPVRYYQRRGGRELDFVLMDQSIGLEVKTAGTPKDLRTASTLREALDLKACYVVTREFRDDPGFIPALDL
jgi:uncharacterized protein